VSDVASAVDNTTAELIDRAHDVTGKLTNGQNARLQASQGARRRRETAIARL